MKQLIQFSDQHLYERLQGLAKNLFFSNGRLLIPSDISNAFWETHAEAKRRGTLPKLDIEILINPNDPEPVFHKNYVVRYSSRRRLEEFKAGIVCFCPAKNYADLTNVAQKDNELQRSWHVADRDFVMKGGSYPASNIVLNQPIKEKGGSFIHYHSLSMSSEESPKLQRAFDADGYVRIHDYTVFYDLLRSAIRLQSPKARCGSGIVNYYDDREKPSLTKITDFVFSKNIAFHYQREARMVVFEAVEPEKWFEVNVSWPADLISPIQSF